MPEIDPFVSENDLTDVAQAAAAVFEDTHLQFASPTARIEVRRTIVALVAASVMSYLRAVIQNPAPNAP